MRLNLAMAILWLFYSVVMGLFLIEDPMRALIHCNTGVICATIYLAHLFNKK